MNNRLLYMLLVLGLVLLALIHVHHGSFNFDFKNLSKSIFQFDSSVSTEVVFREIRVPRTYIALIAGASLAIAGLLMQTYFNNPLAGPSVLGITSGSSLFVAFSVLAGWELIASDYSLVISALIGAFVFSLIILLFSFFVRSAVSLLLIGMMLASFTSAIIQVIQLSTHANDLKAYILWGFGSVQQVSFNQLALISSIFLIGLFSLTFLIKPLNLLVLGEAQAKILGSNLKMNRLYLIAVSSLFAGLITAYCGPISFVGLAVPNMVRFLFKTQNHLKLLIACALVGASTLLVCDLVLIYLEDLVLLPLNAITALVGAPVVVWIILKRF